MELLWDIGVVIFLVLAIVIAVLFIINSTSKKNEQATGIQEKVQDDRDVWGVTNNGTSMESKNIYTVSSEKLGI